MKAPSRRPWFAAARIFAFAALAPAVMLAVVPACDTPDPTEVTEIDAPSYNEFVDLNPTATTAGVSRVLELRCGTLDCHGQVGRALRIYGQYGLRFVEGDADNQPGSGATTPTEYEANYQSVIGLQPEYTTLVYEGALPPEAMLLIRKPLQLERHKGGAVFVSGDDAYNCITSWLESNGSDAGSGGTDYAACYRASQL
jgi:hypothetical protein